MSLNWFHVPDEYFATFSSMALSKSKTVTSSNMISSIGLVKLAKKSDSFFHPTVAQVTTGFARLRRQLQTERPGLVFHSTRKWFVT